MERSLSLTEGHVRSTMLRFALPFLLANLLQALYGAADLLIVGQFSTPAQLSAVATGSQVLQTVTSLVSGLTTGGTILLGQYIGMSSERDVKQTVSTMMSLFAIVALGLVAFVFDTIGGVLVAKVYNLFAKQKINPMIGAAGISAFPMSARVVNKMGLQEDNQNFLLMHAVGVNVSGQIASVIAGGMILTLFA